MLILGVCDRDLLEFRFEQAGETRRVWCKEFGKGQLLLLVEGTSSFGYKTLALLKDRMFREVWPGVRL